MFELVHESGERDSMGAIVGQVISLRLDQMLPLLKEDPASLPDRVQDKRNLERLAKEMLMQEEVVP